MTHEVPGISFLKGINDLLIGSLGTSKLDVVPHILVHKNRLLGHVTYLLSVTAQVNSLNFLAINQDLTSCRVVEAFNQSDDSTLARSGWAYNGSSLSFLKLSRKVSKNFLV